MTCSFPRRNLYLRAKIIQAVRDYFISNDYLEVDTPIRIPAPAPEAFIDAPASGNWFLQTSPELCMKRLLSAGHPRIFQICKCFREKERGRKHVPEFTMLEWYVKDGTYIDLMRQCRELIGYVAKRTGAGDTTLTYQKHFISLKPPWATLSVKDAFKKYTPVSVYDALDTDCFDEMMGLHIEPCLGWKRPVFLYNYPASKAALAKLNDSDPTVAERFELYIAGMELANGFTELTDADEQRRRFEEELADRKTLGRSVYPMPEPFLEELKSMPNAAGIALGIDRLVMVFTDAVEIDAVLAFTPEEL